jgi:uncharacterized membrane-anchored protein
MDAGTKKALKVGLVVMLIAGAAYGSYVIYKYIQRKSSDERKDSRRITFQRN